MDSHRILALTGVITLLALLMLFRMDFNGDVASFVLEGNETGEAFKSLQEKYQAGDPINVLVSLEDGSTFRDQESLAALVRLRDDIAEIDGVAAIASNTLIHHRRLRNRSKSCRSESGICCLLCLATFIPAFHTFPQPRDRSRTQSTPSTGVRPACTIVVRRFARSSRPAGICSRPGRRVARACSFSQTCKRE